MRVQVTMPQLGETVSEGTVTRWLRGQGDSVAADEPLLEIATDKVSVEVPTVQPGVLVEILVREGETVPVGAPLAWLEVAGQDSADAPAPAATNGTAAPSGDPAPAATPRAEDDARPAAAAEDERRPSPLIRRLLKEAGLTAADITASGPGGRILRDDVAAATARTARAPEPPVATATPEPPVAAATAAAVKAGAAALPAGSRSEPLSRIRAVIAERMVSSLQTSAQLTSVVEVDVTRIAELRASARAKISFLPFFARAAVEALESHAEVNASVDTVAGTVTYHDAIHLAIAVDTERGLLAPVIRDAGRLSLTGLAGSIADVAARTRDGSITADELSGGTFTLSNTGSRGALFDTPIINQPQVAILATGAAVRRPVVVTDPDGAEGIAIRSMAYLALTYDHRLIDGAVAAHFLVTMKNRLEEGRFESDLGLARA